MDNNQSSTSSSSSPSPIFVHLLLFAELFLHPTIFAIILLNLVVLHCSSILPSNLRLVLFAQSTSIAFFQFSVFGMAIQKVAFQKDNNNNPPWLGAILFDVSIVSGFYGAITGHLLFLERMLATIFFRKYAKCQWPLLSLFCCAIPLFYYVYFAIGTDQPFLSATNANLFTQITLPTISIIEFFLICCIAVKNSREYNRILYLTNQKRYSLDGKYQLAENIRACKQLWPAFLCHFLQNMLGTCLYVAIIYCNLAPHLLPLAISFTTLSASFLNGLIGITIITHHPVLKSKCKKILRKLMWWWKGRQNQVGDDNGQHSLARNIHGNPLVMESGADKYFSMLQSQWNF